MSTSALSEQFAPAEELSLRDYLAIIRRRRLIFIEVFLVVMAVGVIATLAMRPVYQATSKLSVTMAPPKVSLTQPSTDPLQEIMQTPQDPIPTQITLLNSVDFRLEALKAAKLPPSSAGVPYTIKASQPENSQLIEITVEGPNSQNVAKLANAALTLHLTSLADGQVRDLKRARKFVEDAAVRALATLQAKQHALAVYRATNATYRKDADQQTAIKQYQELATRADAAEANVRSAQAQLDKIQQLLGKTAPTLQQENTEENPRRQKILDKVSDLKYDLAVTLLTYKDTSSKVLGMKKSIADLETLAKAEPPVRSHTIYTGNPMRAQLLLKQAEAQAALVGYQGELTAANEMLTRVKANVSGSQVWQLEVDRLIQERDLAQTSYNNLVNKRTDLRIKEMAVNQPAKEVERAQIPSAPVRPKKVLNFALTTLLALGLGLAMAFLQEYLDDRVHSPDDLERVAQLPTLGHVPMIPSGQSRLVASLPANSHVAEAYRALRSSVGFAGVDTPIRRLQVTSASAGEGKSTTSINLAISMAMDGKKVILVDADLRRPSLHRLLNVPNAPGLSELLVGMHSVDAAIHPTEVENLSFVPAGPVPPNPAELLGSQSFDRIVGELEARADVVVYDTPPCMPVTDPLVVAGRMDGVVLVLHADQTRKAAIRHAVELLTRARARVVGTVFNRVEPNRSGYYYHYYYYYYYGDGYYSDPGNGKGHRRNGKSRRPHLNGGKEMAVAPRGRDEES
jgi:succinoglycan biosynthesis transport protein ExoP